MTKKEFIGAYNIGHRDGKAGDYSPNDYDDIFHLKEPCVDCIRKQDEIRKAYDKGIKNGLIPKAEQEPKTGQVGYWNIDYICSICGCKVYPVDIDNGSFNYCPNCGSKMYEIEEWNGIHGQIVAPKGTFHKIWEDAEKEGE